MISPTDQRLERLKSVAQHRQQDLTVILENVHDPHNIGAVLRTCDSVGIHEIFIIYTEDRLSEENNIEPGKTSSSGSDKWVNINLYRDVKTCFDAVRTNYNKIFATALSSDAVDLYDLNLKQPVALLFGNESAGLSEEALSLADGNFLIPQVGFVQSLNISVACAISLYEAYRQRRGSNTENKNAEWENEIFAKYQEIHSTAKLVKRELKMQKKLKKS